jgi:probable F420-dependent oxidoreductase
MSDEARARLGRVGVWSGFPQSGPATAVRELAAEVEELGYGALWYSEALAKESLSVGAFLLAWTSRIGVASGILNIWGRDPIATANGARTLEDAYPGRFVLGLGISHSHVVQARGHDYSSRPVETMRAYLDGIDAAPYMGHVPDEAVPRLLAALAPGMLALAAERAAGTITYLVPPEHTAVARERLGADAFVAVEQTVVLETDPARAREIARPFVAFYTAADNYRRNLLRLGWTDDDLTGNVDALVDSLVVHGDEAAIAARVRAHFDAGADHVCVQALPSTDPQLEQLRRLAPALLEVGASGDRGNGGS